MIEATNREELATRLADKTRDDLIDLVFRLVSFEKLLTAREIAEASHIAKRDVLADMRAGRFVDPIFGAGFFCRADHSLKVTASAANAWRRSFFVSVPADSIPDKKSESVIDRLISRSALIEYLSRGEASVQSAENERRRSREIISVPADSIPDNKKARAFPSVLQSAENERRRSREIGVERKNSEQKSVVRRLSPGFMERAK